MRKLVSGVMLSLDGVMQAPGGPEEDTTRGFKFGGWAFPYFDEATGQAMGGIFSKPFELLLGRKTYEIFAAHWPYQNDEIGAVFNPARKYVATSSRKPLEWQNSVAIHDVAKDVARLKQEDGPMLLTQGSSVLLQTLLENNLVDELFLLIFPVILGNGKRLFDKNTTPAALKLVDSKSTATGVTINTYRPGGAVQTGSFGHATPSEAELARRARWAREG
jgi:dihydrofolate reductase